MRTRECPSCGWEVDAGEKKCMYCGYEFPGRSRSLQWVAIALVIIFLLYLIL